MPKHISLTILILLCIFIVLPLTTRLGTLFAHPEKIRATIEGNDIYYTAGEIKMHAVQVGDPKEQPILFIHGTPGSYDVFASLLTNPYFAHHTHMISVDRYGFGLSGGSGTGTLRVHTKTIAPLLDQLSADGQKVIVVGHSYGGLVATDLALEHQDQIKALVLIAPTLDPEGEESLWFKRFSQRIVLAPPFRTLVDPDLVLAAREMHTMPSESSNIQNKVSTITIPITIIHGDKDILAPISNIEYLEKNFTGATITVINKNTMNHFIPWSNPDLIVTAIENYLE